MKYIVLVMFSFSSLLIAQNKTKVQQLQVEGTQLVNNQHQSMVLRGMSFGWHTYWPQFYNSKVVNWLKEDWHCNVVRAALGVEQGENSYKTNPSYAKSKIETVIKAAIKNDLYVIVDWHSHNINLKEAKIFFQEISKKYGQYPNVIYEIFNEPDTESWEEVKAYAEEVIATIRKNDSDNIILVGSPSWDQDIHLPAKDPIKGYSNIMYTMHFYAATHKKWLRDRVDEALQNGLPVFVSESAGMEATGDGQIDYDSWQEYIEWMEMKKMSWIVWSISTKDETCSVLKPSASIYGKWKLEDLKDSGIKAREYILKYAAKN